MNKDIKEIYLVGICGVAMATLAGMLKQKGFVVSGSDENVYPPMSDMLREWGIDIHCGFKAENVGHPDLVIIGNAISRGNLEVEYILNKRIPYASMAQVLYNFFLKDKEVISVSGTHGKTTTTALLAHIFEVAGEDPSYFIGGVSRNYNTNFRLGNGGYFIIEGDEYDSAFFEKVPKFTIYRPHHLILTSLEFDHADIYSSLEEIKLWFKRLVNIIPSEGNIVLSGEDLNLDEVSSRSYSRRYTFGCINFDFCYQFLGYSGDSSKLRITARNYEDIEVSTKLFGEFNFANITAAISMALVLGLKKDDIRRAVESFEGVKRRQELIYCSESIKLYEDFAHHPTEIRFLLEEMRKRFPDSTLWAIYEPRSATSRRNVFQEELPYSFASADKIVLKRPYKLNSIPKLERLDIESVLQAIKRSGKSTHLFDSIDEIVDYTFDEIDLHQNNIIAIISNGGFDNIYEKMIDRARVISTHELKKR